MSLIGCIATLSGAAVIPSEVAPAIGSAAGLVGVGGVLTLARGHWVSSTRTARERLDVVMDAIALGPPVGRAATPWITWLQPSRARDTIERWPTCSHGAGRRSRGQSRGTSLKRTWTIIGVDDVSGSLRWYQTLFGQPESPAAHDDFGQLRDSDGTVLLCLHAWGAHGHPPLTSPRRAEPGNGLLLFFRVDDFEESLPRARDLVERLAEEPHVNPSTGTQEFSLRDPDGYYVTISALSEP